MKGEGRMKVEEEGEKEKRVISLTEAFFFLLPHSVRWVGEPDASISCLCVDEKIYMHASCADV